MQGCSSILLISAALLLCLSAVQAEQAASLVEVFTAHDTTRLREVLLAGEPYDNLATPYNMLRGLKAIGVTDNLDVVKKNACGYSLHQMDTSNALSLFYVSSIAESVGSSCVQQVLEKRSEIETFLTQALEGEPSMETLYQVVSTKYNLGFSVNSESVLLSLMTILDNEESVYNSALAFLTAVQLQDVDLSGIFEMIEDIVAQADETPKALYYDTLETTSNVISGIFAMAAKVGEAPSITPEQATKFGNYLVANKYTTNATTAGYLLTAASALDKNEYVVPCSLLLTSTGYISRANPNIQVRLSTILGSAPPTDFTVTLLTMEDQEGLETTPNKPLKAEGGTYSLDLFKHIAIPGVYTLTFSSKATGESPVVELSDATAQVTVSFEVTVSSAQLLLVDREHETVAKTISLEYPNSSTSILDADQHSKVVMKFTLLNKETKKSVQVHQAFVRLSFESLEIYFVATANKKTNQYTFDLDLTTAADDFGRLSGTYSIALIVGDFAVENPFSWDVGSVNLVFAGANGDSVTEDYTYKPKPEIQHMFRPDEKLPPKVISSTFTVLVLSPLAVLVVLWVAVGVNVSGFVTGGIWALIFHVGLGGIFVIYYLFWVQLNMFTTLKLLAALSVPTFLAGNKLLRLIANANKQSA